MARCAGQSVQQTQPKGQKQSLIFAAASQVQRAQQLAAVARTVQREFAEELEDLSTLGVEAKLRAKLESLQQKTQLLNEESSAVASSLQEVELLAPR